MHLSQFLFANSSALFALLGVLVTLLITWTQQKTNWANQKYLRKTGLAIEIEKSIQFDPIAKFIESYLSLLQMTYSKGLNKDDAPTPEMSDQSTMRMLAASARIKLYGDAKLVEKFDNLTRKRIEIGNSLFDKGSRNVNLAYDLLREAENTAAEILGILKSKLLDSAG